MAVKAYPVTQDSALFRGPCLYYGGFLRATGGGVGEAEVRDGNADSDQLVDYFRAAASDRDRNQLPQGIFLLRGCFVDLVANVDTFVVWLDFDIPDGASGPRSGP